ncbi:arsenate reductase [Kiloniella spongiae]|uniref:Arsenate reductase n=1 Tax=Kiloniella spongiae TaxID=1489064 RepID=A0A0H2MS07_9PROT|nr:arsenate reductase (glutaredoxin) [Kiloniella spongiae]KLN59430.1 arsenate reductase [Kiloniella spongiae]
MTVKILHNSRCSKSRETLKIIEEQGHDVTIIEYLKGSITEVQLMDILKQLDLNPRDLLRKGEEIYKELSLSNTNLSNEELIKTMIKHPILIERPIVTSPKGARIGRPPESVLDIL